VTLFLKPPENIPPPLPTIEKNKNTQYNMKRLFLGLLTALTVNISFGQQTVKLDYCNCQEKIEQISPVLNGQFELKCNGLLIEKGEFVNGLKNGEWITYSRKGKLIRKMNYNNGLLHGKVELFYLNGKPKVAGQFDKGSKIGKWIYYTDKGMVLSEGSYDSNKPIDTWIINDKKGKKPVVQYDFNSKKHLLNSPTPFHKDGDIIQNENTEEWYILKSPDLKYSSKSEPLGGYAFANYMFIELVEVPENLWDTYLYQKYKVSFKIASDNNATFESQLITGNLPDKKLELTFLIMTNPPSKIKRIEHSDFQIKLIDLKIKEALSLMPPWIYNEQSDIDLYIHYVINQNLQRQ
jgi:antitoxin component YwqK of YwqJK toxin-antitoxin module